jgi:hypothetical protein
MNNITEEILLKHNIISLQEMKEINEVGSAILPKCLHVKYTDGTSRWVRGDKEVNNFVNSLLISR